MDNALDLAEQTYVNVNIHREENKEKLRLLKQLPDSCFASAECLSRQRACFEKYNVFSPNMIDGIIAQLRSFNDASLRAGLENKPEEMLKLVNRYFHCG
jgi:glutamine synthetase